MRKRAILSHCADVLLCEDFEADAVDTATWDVQTWGSGAATIDGARALGMDRMIGSLEAGKRADVITVSMTAARQTPMYDPLSHLVYVTRGDDVKTTIVNGRVLMRDRKMLTLDEPRVLSDARALADKVKAAVR